ncbi:MAG: glycosyl hydrolase [bacterium]|nr:glycosyl hydrolase [bacterium]
MMQPKEENLISKALQTLEREYVAVGKTRVRAWHAWLSIGVAVGILIGIMLVANRSGELTVGLASGTGYDASSLPFAATPQNGWGHVEINMSNGETASGDGKPITLNGVVYQKGLGAHAYSEITYNLNGQYSSFLSDIGVDDEVGASGTITFQVIADGLTLYNSGVMNGSSATKQVNVNVSGKNQLKLIITDGGNGIGSDHGDWANAILIPTAISTTGLVGWWKFDDGLGTSATDSSGNANTGTLINGPIWSTEKLARALSFDGIDDNVQTPSNILQTANNFTIIGWFKANTTANIGHILWEGTATGGGWGKGDGDVYSCANSTEKELHLTIGGNPDGATGATGNYLSFFIGCTDYVSGNGINLITPFTDTVNWHFVAVTAANLDNAPIGKLYLDNGSAVNLMKSDTALVSEMNRSAYDTNMRFGRAGSMTTDPNRFFNGKINEVRIYNRALSASEIINIYNAEKGTVTPTPTQTPTPTSTPTPTPPSLSCSIIGSNAFYGCYYDNITGTSPSVVIDTSSLKLTRTDASINFDWTTRSPSTVIGIDTFAAVWQGDFIFGAGTHRFTATTDDGMRLYVDGVLKIDKWFVQGPTTYTTDVSLISGKHRIKVEYYENTVGSVAKVSWAPFTSPTPTPTPTTVPTQLAQVALPLPSPTPTLTSTPTLPSTNPVVYLKFEGNALDSSGNNNNGILVNGPIFVTGKVGQGQALKFDGVNDYVNANNSSSMNITGSALSVSAWINYSSNFNNAFINKESSYELGISGTGTLKSAIWTTAGWIWVDSNIAVPKNQWVLVSTTYDGTNDRFYINGVLVNTQAHPNGGAITGSSNPLRIAARGVGAGTNFVPVSLDDIRIYNRALSASDIVNIYNAEKGTVTPTPTPTPTPTSTPTPTPTPVSMPPITFSPGLLKKSLSNPRYFADPTGKIVFTTGSHNGCELQDAWGCALNPFNYSAYLNFLQSHSMNLIRMWSVEHTRVSTDAPGNEAVPMPYLRTGPGNALDGKPKFNLNQFDQSYFDRLRSRVIDAGNRGIYVSYMFFQGVSIWPPGGNHTGFWFGHYFNINNNINGINGDANGDGLGYESHSLTVPAVTAIQEAYVKKVIDTIGDLNNVIFEISNEDGRGTIAWQQHFIDYIHNYESGKPKQHLVGITYRNPGGTDAELFSSTADWISPDDNATNPGIASGNKISIIDTDHTATYNPDPIILWKFFARGYNLWLLDDLSNMNGSTAFFNSVPSRNALKYIQIYAKKMNLAAMTPQGALTSTGYALANVGTEYLIYQPKSNTAFTLNLAVGTYAYEWFNPTTGLIVQTSSVSGGATKSFTAPFSGDAVLYLKVSSAPTPTPTQTTQSASTLMPTPPPTGFVKGDRVQVSAAPSVNVLTKAYPYPLGIWMGTELLGAQGKIIDGPVFSAGWGSWQTWNTYQVQYDNGLTGWSIGDFLTKVPAPTYPYTGTNPFSNNRQGLINYLNQLSNNPNSRLISAAFLNFSASLDNPQITTAQAVFNLTGQWPGLVQARYNGSWQVDEFPQPQYVNQALIDYWNHGGLVEIMDSGSNPITNRATQNLNVAYTPGTPENKKFLASLDAMAAGFKELQDKGVIVLWRPFFEVQGGWSWWSGSPPYTIALWRYTYNYMTVTKNLNNIIWVYAPNFISPSHQSDPAWAALSYYPGDQYVDVVGLDVYTSTITPANIGGYTDLVSTGKPFIFAEFGPNNAGFDYLAFLNAIKTYFPKTISVMPWEGGPNWGLGTGKNAKAYMDDPWVLNRGELGGGVTPPTPGASICTNLLNSTTAVPTSFGASFNWLSSAKELLMNVICSGSSATANIGNGSNTQYIYKTGYAWQNSQWTPFNYSGSSMDSGGNWFIGSANRALGTLDLTQKQSVLSYICDWNGSSWKCGCNDNICSTSYWNLQQFKQ